MKLMMMSIIESKLGGVSIGKQLDFFVIGSTHKMKGKFDCTALRPAIFYCSECWAVNGQREPKIGVVEMRILKWMSDHIRNDKISNNFI